MWSGTQHQMYLQLIFWSCLIEKEVLELLMYLFYLHKLSFFLACEITTLRSALFMKRLYIVKVLNVPSTVKHPRNNPGSIFYGPIGIWGALRQGKKKEGMISLTPSPLTVHIAEFPWKTKASCVSLEGMRKAYEHMVWVSMGPDPWHIWSRSDITRSHSHPFCVCISAW